MLYQLYIKMIAKIILLITMDYADTESQIDFLSIVLIRNRYYQAITSDL